MLSILLQEKAQEMRDNENPADEALQNERAKAKSKYRALDNLILESDYFVVLTPVRADIEDLSRKRRRGRPKKAAPALQRMDADIAAGVVLGAITDV